MNAPSPLTARQVISTYEPDFPLTCDPSQVEDPAVCLASAHALPPEARALLEAALLVAPVGEALPPRLRPRIEQEGRALWASGLLIPLVTGRPAGAIHPSRYAASCRINPALSLRPLSLLPEIEATPAFPPADARWDAVIVAAAVEQEPLPLRQNEAVRRDAEKRLMTRLGPDIPRWSLALRVATATRLLRGMGARLEGFPEASPGSLSDLPGLTSDRVVAAAIPVWLRVVRAGWISIEAAIAAMAEQAREVIAGPLEEPYRGTAISYTEGWARVEAPALRAALELLHRVRVVERDASGQAVRLAPPAGPPVAGAPATLLTPDGDLLVPSGEIALRDFGRLARLAPYMDGDRVYRLRLKQAGLAADLAAGHTDTAGFLARLSRIGVPPSVADLLREWGRSAQRITVLTGVEIVEEEGGGLRRARPGEVAAKVIDYASPGRGSFRWEAERIRVRREDASLTLQAALRRIAVERAPEGEERVWEVQVPPQARPVETIARLAPLASSGALPAEVELAILAAGPSVTLAARPLWAVSIPPEVLAPLRRDPFVEPLLRRELEPGVVALEEEEWAQVQRRLKRVGLL